LGFGVSLQGFTSHALSMGSIVSANLFHATMPVSLDDAVFSAGIYLPCFLNGIHRFMLLLSMPVSWCWSEFLYLHSSPEVLDALCVVDVFYVLLLSWSIFFRLLMKVTVSQITISNELSYYNCCVWLWLEFYFLWITVDLIHWWFSLVSVFFQECLVSILIIEIRFSFWYLSH
jgi:hypothetical protein